MGRNKYFLGKGPWLGGWGPFLSASDGMGASAMMMAGQSTPHSLFVLDKKRTGRGRSKRKNRCGGSVRASAYLRPPAGEGWRSLAAVRDGNAFPLGGTKPGEVPDTVPSLSAGAALAVCQASCFIPVTRPLSTARVASKRGQKDRPFDNHPEVCTNLAIAAQDLRK